MKGFYITVSLGLLEKKHYLNMKESVWLFLWYLDKMTSVSEEGIGKVLGGKPITYEEVNEDLQLPLRTYRRWVERLKRNGYINVIRTPYGLSISVNRAQKVFGKQIKKTYAKSGTSNVPKVAHQVTKNGTSNIRQDSRQNNNKKKEIIKKEKEISPTAHSPGGEFIAFLEKFNLLFSSHYQVTSGRQKKFSLRKKAFSLEQIIQALENLASSPFHRGKNDRGWRADPDFLLRSDEQIDKWLNVPDSHAPPKLLSDLIPDI